MFNKREPSYLMGWDDEAKPVLGEGLSRTSKSHAVLWQVDVINPGNRPMFTTVRATSKSEALKFSKNRYPTATSITVIGKANGKTN
jgi:hypothetical protein